MVSQAMTIFLCLLGKMNPIIATPVIIATKNTDKKIRYPNPTDLALLTLLRKSSSEIRTAFSMAATCSVTDAPLPKYFRFL